MGEERGGVQNCAVAAEGGCKVDFLGEQLVGCGACVGLGGSGRVDWEGKEGLEGEGDGGLEDEGDIGVGLVDVSDWFD